MRSAKKIQKIFYNRYSGQGGGGVGGQNVTDKYGRIPNE